MQIKCRISNSTPAIIAHFERVYSLAIHPEIPGFDLQLCAASLREMYEELVTRRNDKSRSNHYQNAALLASADMRPKLNTVEALTAPAMADERETAQWYTVNSQCAEIGWVFDGLTLADRRQCYQFGQLVNWARLPLPVKDALRRQLHAVRLMGLESGRP